MYMCVFSMCDVGIKLISRQQLSELKKSLKGNDERNEEGVRIYLLRCKKERLL